MPDLLQPQPPPTWRDRIAELRVLVTPVRVVAGVVGSVAVGVLAFLFLRTPPPPSELILPRADGSAPAAAAGGAVATTSGAGAGSAAPSTGGEAPGVGPGPPGTGGMVTVHAAGQVSVPGVYSLPAGARVADVVTAAGGLAPEAAADSLNLAAKVADGSRIYVPRKGEQVPPAGGPDPGGGSDVAGAGSRSSTGEALVDLNSATAEQLDALPGVGPATSSAILTYRARHGRFKSVTELLEVPGIGPAKLEALRPLVTIR